MKLTTLIQSLSASAILLCSFAQGATKDLSSISCVAPFRFANSDGLALLVPPELLVANAGYTTCGANCRDYTSAGLLIVHYLEKTVDADIDRLVAAAGADSATQMRAAKDFLGSVTVLQYVYLNKIVDAVETGLCKQDYRNNPYFWERSHQKKTQKSLAYMRISSFSQPIALIGTLLAKYNWLIQRYLNGTVDDSTRAIQLEAYIRINEYKYLSAKMDQLVRAIEPLANQDKLDAIPAISSAFATLSGDLTQLEGIFSQVLKEQPELARSITLMKESL